MTKEELIQALLDIGFKQMYPDRPHRLNYEGYPIVVESYDTYTSIMKKVFKAGQTVKVWHIKNALEIVS